MNVITLINKIMKPFCLIKAKKIYKECNKFLGKTVLDIGAGRCLIAKEIKNRRRCDIICLDVKDLNETELKLIVYGGKKIPFKDKTFESVLLVYVLHHCNNPEAVLKEAARVSKGNIIIFEDIDSKITRFCDFFVNKILHRVDTPLNFKSDKEWKGLFKSLNLYLVKYKTGVEKEWFYPVKHIMYVLNT